MSQADSLRHIADLWEKMEAELRKQTALPDALDDDCNCCKGHEIDAKKLDAALSRVAGLEAALREMVHEAQRGFIHGLAKTTPDWGVAVDRYYDAARAALRAGEAK
jgi:hypothetical protein